MNHMKLNPHSEELLQQFREMRPTLEKLSEDTDYDFFASSIAPQNLCLVYVMKNDGSREALKRLYDMLNGAQDSNGNAADQIMEMAKTLPFMSKKTD